MIHFLFSALAGPEHGPGFADSIMFRSVMAALTAFCLCVVFVGRLVRFFRERRIEEKVEAKDSEKLAEMHSAKAHTPTMGGVGIVAAMVSAVLLWSRLGNPYVLLGMFAVLSLSALGFWDDYVKLKVPGKKGLGIRERLVYQSAFMIAVSASLYSLGDEGGGVSFTVPLIKASLFVLPAAVFIPAVSFILVSTVNSVNFTDGLDGLASGCVAIAAVPLLVFAYASGRPDYSAHLSIPFIPGGGELAVFAAALAGAGAGFLWFNCHPAQIFMGNTGSLPLGGAIGYLACAAKQELLLPVVGAVFAVEGLSVLLQVGSYRLRNGRRVFLCAPIHHHYQFKGWPETRITTRFWIAAGVSAAAAIAMLRI